MSPSPAANQAENQHPWVAYGLLVLCAIALTYTKSLERDVRSSADSAVEVAAAYWTERPYLEPADMIVEKLTAEVIQSRRAEFQRDRSGKGSIGVPKAVRSHYQEILDGLTANALEPLSQLPHYRMGVRVSKPEGLSYLAHAFLHSGWLHLLGNGILLLILGCYIERVWGHTLFGVFAIVCSIAAATAFRIGNPELNASLIGTSGMIAGLLAAFTLRFASRWTEASYCTVIVGGLCWLTLPAGFGWDWSVVPGPTASSETVEAANASLSAIVGGLGCGLAIASMIMFGKIETILFDTGPTPAKKPSVDPELEAALDAHANGRSEEAFELLSTLLERKPEHRAGLLAMWELALDLGQPSDASRAMLLVIRDEVRRNAPSAVEHWLDLSSRGLHGGAEPALLIHVALMLCEADRRREALSALESALEISANTDSPDIAMRVARASRPLDRSFSEAAAWCALGSAELSLNDRQNLEALLGELYREAPEAPSQSELQNDARASSQPALSSERSDSGSRVEDRSLQWEDPGLANEMSPASEEPLTPVNVRDPDGSVAEPVASVRPAPIDLEITSRELRVVNAQPTELNEDGIVVEIEGGDKRKIGFERIDAVSVVAVDGLGPKFVIVIDLVLNWMSEPPEPLKVIRLRGDRFDPRQFSPDHDVPLDAIRQFTARILGRSNAMALPDTRSVQGTPFASFANLASYHRTVFSVDEEIAETDLFG
jgi:membrane associated rhomboid family serine protease/tetratricopeptide (TPR) repeat protein